MVLAGCLDPAALFGDTGPSLPEALLRSDPYPDLVVEIDHAPGRVPCAGSLAALEAVLLFATGKRSVRVLAPTPMAAGDGDYDNAELARLHADAADSGPATGFGRGDAAYLHIVYLNGHAESRNGGHAAGRTLYQQGALFVFPDAFESAYEIRAGFRSDASCAAERAVLLHELGHAFGLVNRGIPMLHDREADDHAGHSTNPASVMYPTLRIAADGRVLTPLPTAFDANDLADLAAYRAG